MIPGLRPSFCGTMVLMKGGVVFRTGCGVDGDKKGGCVFFRLAQDWAHDDHECKLGDALGEAPAVDEGGNSVDVVERSRIACGADRPTPRLGPRARR